jgi:hypothetical protein
VILNDNALTALVITELGAQLALQGFSDVVIQQAYQPTQQGIPTLATVYIYRSDTDPYGFSGVQFPYNSLSSDIDSVETQLYEDNFSIQTLVIQDPNNLTYTSMDLAIEVHSILSSVKFISFLRSYNIGILRPRGIKNSYFVDDKDNFQSLPTFNFTLVHLGVRLSKVEEVIPPIGSGIYGV